jgi:leader peptidase (prepilin peptidase) / N-methyltransferase
MVNEITQAYLSGNKQGSASQVPSTSTQHGAPGSLWLAYVRMLGIPTALCSSLGAVLHQLECSLRDEPTHWGATSLLVGIGLSLAFALWLGTSRGTRVLVIVAILCCSVLMGGLGWLDLCDEHRALYFVLIGVAVAIGGAVIKSQLERSSGPAIRKRHEHASQTVSDACRPVYAEQTAALSSSISGTHASDIAAQSSAGAETIADEVTGDLRGVIAEVRRPSWSRHALGIVLAAGFLIYMVIVPGVGMLIEWITRKAVTSRLLTDMSLSESIRLHAVSGVVMLMFLVAGASIGSFLNVVIYRLPRRRDLLWPPSACPNCETRIAGKDNVPILAWLKLGGRCRQCQFAISARYPIIEALVGSVFVLFYYTELLSGGANLPVRQPNSYNGIVWILLYTKWDLVTLYFFHMLLLVLLLAWGMINYDRFRVPWVSVLLTSGLFLCLPSVFPHLNPTAADWLLEQLPVPTAMLATATGFLTGGLLGLILEFAFRYLRTNERHAMSSPAPFTEHYDLALASVNVDRQTVELQVAPLPSTQVSGFGHGNAIVDELEWDSASTASSSFERVETSAPAVIDGAVNLYGAASKAPTTRGNAAASLALVGAALGFEAVAIVGLLTFVGSLLTLAAQLFSNKLAGRSFARPVPLTLVTFGCTVLLLLSWSAAHRYFTQFL